MLMETMAAPAVKANVEERLVSAFGELAVVPTTCFREMFASFRFILVGDFPVVGL